MKKQLVCLAIGSLLALGANANAAEPAQTGQDCANLAEVALLARALAEEKIEKPRAQSILARIYDIPDEQARSLARLVLESAYRDSSPADEFASKFEVVCRASRGDVESLLKAGKAPGGGALQM